MGLTSDEDSRGRTAASLAPKRLKRLDHQLFVDEEGFASERQHDSARED
eukprot:CAMPEP_0119519766 /NCGR_PEP_ID=MMETSP1344-20130328/35967_1 /TAXON_ID=236787 /ORGANISM="Florenciella parvula, Strain CCMP2471" /LENGTH=48 /DNA_ID= /DNA_START= /DNA_END= /DNA_ORIENTATION=